MDDAERWGEANLAAWMHANGVSKPSATEAARLRTHIVTCDTTPGGGVFSHGKRQCDLWEFVWGTSILFSRLLYRLAPAFRINIDDKVAPGRAGSTTTLDDNYSNNPFSPANINLRRGSILEVGCGSALCALTCAMSGARRVVATDSVEDANS